MTTQASQVAALIRKQLKAAGIPAKTTSKNYSMGSSVTVTLLDDPLPATVAAVEKETAQYKYGYFDGMQDMYVQSNRRNDIPQTKHLFVDARYSDQIKQEAWDWLQARYRWLENAPSDYAEACGTVLSTGEWAEQVVHQVLHDQNSHPGFWSSRKPRKRA